MKKRGGRTFGQEKQRLTWRLRLGKFEVGPLEKLTLNKSAYWAWVVSETKHDKGIETYREAPVVSSASEWRGPWQMEPRHTK